MGAEQIRKSLLYSELVVGKHNLCRPKLCFKEVCKYDLKSLNIRTDGWELLANDCFNRRPNVHKGMNERRKKNHETEADEEM